MQVYKREPLFQLKILICTLKWIAGVSAAFLVATLLTMWFFASASGHYHCEAEGGYLKGNYCVIEVAK